MTYFFSLKSFNSKICQIEKIKTKEEVRWSFFNCSGKRREYSNCYLFHYRTLHRSFNCTLVGQKLVDWKKLNVIFRVIFKNCVYYNFIKGKIIITCSYWNPYWWQHTQSWKRGQWRRFQAPSYHWSRDSNPPWLQRKTRRTF